MNFFILKRAYPEAAGQTLFLGSKFDDDHSDSDMEDIEKKMVKGCELLIPSKESSSPLFSIKIVESSA